MNSIIVGRTRCEILTQFRYKSELKVQVQVQEKVGVEEGEKDGEKNQPFIFPPLNTPLIRCGGDKFSGNPYLNTLRFIVVDIINSNDIIVQESKDWVMDDLKRLKPELDFDTVNNDPRWEIRYCVKMSDIIV